MWKPVAEQITVSYYNKIHRTSPTLQQSLYNAVSNSWFKSLIAHTPCSPVTCPKKPSGRKETRQDSASVLPRHPIVATFNIASPELHGLCLPAPYGSVCVCVCVCVCTYVQIWNAFPSLRSACQNHNVPSVELYYVYIWTDCTQQTRESINWFSWNSVPQNFTKTCPLISNRLKSYKNNAHSTCKH